MTASQSEQSQDVVTPNPALGNETLPVLADEFEQALLSVGGECTRVKNQTEAIGAVSQLLVNRALSSSVRRVGCSDALLANEITSAACKHISEQHPELGWELVSERETDATNIFTLDVGITSVQWGIAETGTLVLYTRYERNRLLSLIPPVHIALLRIADLHLGLSDVLHALGTTINNGGNAVTFITGPSRTSDIELIPVVGVHGPQRLHVILIQDHPEHDASHASSSTNFQS